MSISARWLGPVLLLWVSISSTVLAAPRRIPINRQWDVLEVGKADPSSREMFLQAGELLGSWAIYIDAVRFDGARLRKLAKQAPKEPFTRVVREGIRRPLDLEDFLYFLDDVLRAGPEGLRGELVWLPASRARRAGIFLHPDDVFWDDRPRVYGQGGGEIEIDKPAKVGRLPPAADGELLGPRWRGRFPNPSGRKRKLAAMDAMNPSGFANRVRTLMKQLSAQGATVLLYSTVREPRRGYLMWGAYHLSRQPDEASLEAAVTLVEQRDAEWGLGVKIRWRHPDGWEATVEAARQMADAYMIAYASEEGARASQHYGGTAVDLNVFGLPRTLLLTAPDGTERRFDLSAPRSSRDLSLTPTLIDWIEIHFQMKKLREDYPHWDDGAPAPVESR